jgi:hypothetical protein
MWIFSRWISKILLLILGFAEAQGITDEFSLDFSSAEANVNLVTPIAWWNCATINIDGNGGARGTLIVLQMHFACFTAAFHRWKNQVA